ncbi:MAG TPA: type II toxin-antitoxin system VapC family toxin [Pyrinomonadaceae bacterium]|nr:type II toxin-antitoxin system VapC family toxin [Pyrinomonadaceae bacterium]
MNRPVFDVNVFVEYRKLINDYQLSKMALSSVVLYELTATTIDKSERQKYTIWRKLFTELDRFLVPTSEDWWEASKIASRIRFGEKSKAKGKTPKNPQTQRLQNDILIARTAYSRKFFVVTSNLTEFLKIRQFLNVEIVSTEEYFGSEI